MSLTSYQQAVLQEMGIPVWITKDAHAKMKKQEDLKEGSTSAPMHGAAASTSPQTPFSQNGQENKPSKPISQEEKQSRLAQLRANVGSGAKDKPKLKVAVTDETPTRRALTNEAAEKNVANKLEVAQSESKGSESPEGIPLSAEQRAKSQQWLKDLQLACVQLGIPSYWSSTVMIGRTLSVNETAIVLPAAPLKLTTEQKRALWAQLVSAGKALNNASVAPQ
ncbi:alanine acetyltransferase [Alteromonas sp. PRIM-21]|uniref:alanine acetyltransferase n=1 Tax=Alteromonas sp. PRIM-21 TaxID=1454978 RepID=UPI0022B9590B|nr:alanine acetyltransferase [Alteromonas sp. PRIM-21]MCZ8528020.1 alanine acetyltransferase [Alteromonas sp. PRIM-21]